MICHFTKICTILIFLPSNFQKPYRYYTRRSIEVHIIDEFFKDSSLLLTNEGIEEALVAPSIDIIFDHD